MLICPTLECLKINNFLETGNCSLLLRMAMMQMDCILKNLASTFQSSHSHLMAKPKMHHRLLLQKID